eukprot:TRINITY_DN18412_c0_g1_i1.p5 TRINITY_DN18412_c0_g1~~TRINITY_DN18412_c0_g1_i1.p5  ORF type:complete len:129 (+),score=61.56 TRINITY_DN18412_c0_g1_i1:52-387(+)
MTKEGGEEEEEEEEKEEEEEAAEEGGAVRVECGGLVVHALAALPAHVENVNGAGDALAGCALERLAAGWRLVPAVAVGMRCAVLALEKRAVDAAFVPLLAHPPPSLQYSGA